MPGNIPDGNFKEVLKHGYESFIQLKDDYRLYMLHINY